MLQEMLTGTRAWAGLSHTAVVLQVSALGRSLEVPAGLPPALDDLARGCLARDPAARPTFAEAAGKLAGWLQATRADDLSGTMVGRREPGLVGEDIGGAFGGMGEVVGACGMGVGPAA
jgi:hypothetical protein